ncbi:putative hydroxypyruvate reductase [bacterium BMS3Abin09]|nr:putative hydroxypyruvate reductase [bacterium BMS3Abin09]GBE41260.1 putative hydroxypyruvate reductase [bacterium BMS3Bbin09]HDH33897.1 glycerate kinase [Nitrospirota bacterium]HDN94668.1 glycerate kinase [Nitrospirota bacterium]
MKTNVKVSKIFMDALKKADPSFLVKAHAGQIRSYISVREYSRIMLVGFGKAAYQMAKAFEEELPDLVMEGVIVTKYGHAQKSEVGRSDPAARRPASGSRKSEGLKNIKVYEAGHPIPDKNGVKAAVEIVDLLKGADEKTLVLCLVSGGGSALFVCPYEGITLAEKQVVTDLLLRAGADITELNAVRKHISMVKGGRLAEIAFPAEIVTFMISDVVGDKLDVIASGPTAPDTSTFRDAINVINKYGLAEKAPGSVMEVLARGDEGLIPETPKKSAAVFNKVNNLIIGSNRKALDAAVISARSMGYETEILSSKLIGDAHKAAKWLAGKSLEFKAKKDRLQLKPRCLICGGETTVTVKGKGKGGRNTEFALVFAMEVEGIESITMLSAGTDGTDGPTDAAGAMVNGETIESARGLGLDPEKYLEENDSYNFFNKMGSLIITGPTGTNVMDIQIVIID